MTVYGEARLRCKRCGRVAVRGFGVGDREVRIAVVDEGDTVWADECRYCGEIEATVLSVLDDDEEEEE